MEFLHTDLGYRKRGEIVRVTLRGNAANVRLMDWTNFSSYKRGRQHRFYGGGVKRSPVDISIPRSVQRESRRWPGGVPRTMTRPLERSRSSGSGSIGLLRRSGTVSTGGRIRRSSYARFFLV